MMDLWECGVNFNDSQFLIDNYSQEIDFIFDRLPKISQKKLLLSQLQDAETYNVANFNSQEGLMHYRNWRLKKLDTIQELDRKEELTFFEKQRRKKRKENNLFGKLKAMRKYRGV